MTAHKYAGGLKKLNLRSDSQRHSHFVLFFNVPIQAPTRGHPFYMIIPRNRIIYDTLGIRRTHSRLNPRVLTGHFNKNYVRPFYTNIIVAINTLTDRGNSGCTTDVKKIRKLDIFVTISSVFYRVCQSNKQLKTRLCWILFQSVLYFVLLTLALLNEDGMSRTKRDISKQLGWASVYQIIYG